MVMDLEVNTTFALQYGQYSRAFSVFDSVYMEQMMVAFGQWTWVHLMWAHNAIGHVTRVGSS